ncbi:unnamed protein product [Musa hybrid cultivar]
MSIPFHLNNLSRGPRDPTQSQRAIAHVAAALSPPPVYLLSLRFLDQKHWEWRIHLLSGNPSPSILERGRVGGDPYGPYAWESFPFSEGCRGRESEQRRVAEEARYDHRSATALGRSTCLWDRLRCSS